MILPVETTVAIDAPIDALQEHPRQREFFSDTSDVELQELAADLERRGQQEPIHLCADGKTLVRGHRRVAAAKWLGWKTLKAIIHPEWTDPNAIEVIGDLVNDNLQRRQLTELEFARCYRELRRFCIATGQPYSRDELARRLNYDKDGRTLERLENLLKLPVDVQRLITAKTLTKDQGAKILKLSKTEREEVYEALRRGEPVKRVLLDCGITKPKRQTTAIDVFQKLLKQLIANQHYFADNIEEFADARVTNCANAVEFFQWAADFFDELAELRAASDAIEKEYAEC